jgi:hypothetical protein
MKLLYLASGVSNREAPIPSWVPDWTQSDALEKRPINVMARAGSFIKLQRIQLPRSDWVMTNVKLSSQEVCEQNFKNCANHLPDLDADPGCEWLPQNFFKEVECFSSVESRTWPANRCLK